MFTAGLSCRRAAILFLLLIPGALPASDEKSRARASAAISGRWDLVVKTPDGEYPAWLEVRRSGSTTLVGAFVGRFGSARPISRVEFSEGQVRFAVPPQWEARKDDLLFEGQLDGDELRGETTDEKGRRLTWLGRPAPALKRERPPRWGEPMELWNRQDLAGWKPRSRKARNGWVARGGVLVNAAPGVDLVSERKFTDFKLHAEFRYPKGSNSGIYLRGRYEVQIEDNYGDEPDSHKIGGIYGFLTPSVNAAKKAGEWQTLDITLVGRVLTIVFNGERIIDRQTIPGITGGALDSDEGSPGPILLQGDHGPIDFRRLTLTPGE
ncbi:MAG TPA: DUF1080 domain-containing protein [Gemmataceae bacterium]|nr:DUF1080 domain-containing protein [Gemmataceae bacterium]